MKRKKQDELVIVYCLYPSKLSANQVIRQLLENRIIVCANVIPAVESHYLWKGKLEKSKEVIVLYKSLRAKLDSLKRALVSSHNYETPFVGEISLSDVNRSYLQYAIKNIRTTYSGKS